MSDPKKSVQPLKELQYVRGFPFPAGPSGKFKKETLESVLDYVPRDGDVVITAYPKTGTTWLQYIILQIMTRGERFPQMGEGVPFMEIAGVEAVEALKSPRIYKNHVPYNLMNITKNAKYITMYRNPADTLVSYFHFQREMGNDRLDFEQFFEDFVTGDIAYGSYFEHVLSYYRHRNDSNLLFLSYEKLLADRKDGILRIAEFLGEEYSKDLEKNGGSLLEKIMERTSFEYMKENLCVNAAGPKTRKINFFRKGTRGDGKNSLSAEQRKRLRVITEETMIGTDISKEWLEE